MPLKPLLAVATAAALFSASTAEAAASYDVVVAPILGSNGRPLADDGGRVDGRTFYFSIGADETPTPDISALFKDPNYRIKSYSYAEFGSTARTTVPATLGKNIVFANYTNQGGLSLTNSGNRNFAVYGDAIGGSQGEVLYDDAAYQTALKTNSAAQPVFKLGTFTLSTYPRNGSATQPIQNYTVAIALAGAVPEPASWAMMAGGVALAGGTMRRRRARRAGAAGIG